MNGRPNIPPHMVLGLIGNMLGNAAHSHSDPDDETVDCGHESCRQTKVAITRFDNLVSNLHNNLEEKILVKFNELNKYESGSMENVYAYMRGFEIPLPPTVIHSDTINEFQTIQVSVDIVRMPDKNEQPCTSVHVRYKHEDDARGGTGDRMVKSMILVELGKRFDAMSTVAEFNEGACVMSMLDMGIATNLNKFMEEADHDK